MEKLSTRHLATGGTVVAGAALLLGAGVYFNNQTELQAKIDSGIGPVCQTEGASVTLRLPFDRMPDVYPLSPSITLEKSGETIIEWWGDGDVEAKITNPNSVVITDNRNVAVDPLKDGVLQVTVVCKDPGELPEEGEMSLQQQLDFGVGPVCSVPGAWAEIIIPDQVTRRELLISPDVLFSTSHGGPMLQVDDGMVRVTPSDTSVSKKIFGPLDVVEQTSMTYSADFADVTHATSYVLENDQEIEAYGDDREIRVENAAENLLPRGVKRGYKITVNCDK